MKNMNTHLATMANTWSRAEEREQEIIDKSNKVLGVLLQIEGLTSSQVLQAADILTAEPNKLRVFYQAPPNLRRQYIFGLLYVAPGGYGSRVIWIIFKMTILYLEKTYVRMYCNFTLWYEH